jgi:hypothetical protein
VPLIGDVRDEVRGHVPLPLLLDVDDGFHQAFTIRLGLFNRHRDPYQERCR